jgi:hypothetical protein
MSGNLGNVFGNLCDVIGDCWTVYGDRWRAYCESRHASGDRRRAYDHPWRAYGDRLHACCRTWRVVRDPRRRKATFFGFTSMSARLTDVAAVRPDNRPDSGLSARSGFVHILTACGRWPAAQYALAGIGRGAGHRGANA